MRDFITCLEFLTRIRFSNRNDWHDDDFSRSVPYFPLVGLVMGIFMGAVNYGLVYLDTPSFMRGVMLVLAELIIIVLSCMMASWIHLMACSVPAIGSVCWK